MPPPRSWARSSARWSPSPSQTLGYILCLYSGFFLYMGATDLLPEAHSHASWARVALTASGFALIFAITRVAGV